MKNRLTRLNNHLSIVKEVEGTFFEGGKTNKLTTKTTSSKCGNARDGEKVNKIILVTEIHKFGELFP